MRDKTAAIMVKHRRLVILGILLAVFLVVGTSEVLAIPGGEIACEANQAPIHGSETPGNIPDEITC